MGISDIGDVFCYLEFLIIYREVYDVFWVLACYNLEVFEIVYMGIEKFGNI